MKPGCYTQLHIHLVFVVKSKAALLSEEIRPRIFEYMGGIINKKGNKSLIINGISDHVHLLFSLNPVQSLSEIVHDIKRNTSLFINNEQLTKNRFNWQSGYGAFTCSHSQIDKVFKYIENQEQHHLGKSFSQEFKEILNKCSVDYDEKYLFENII
jgi:putative transposase